MFERAGFVIPLHPTVRGINTLVENEVSDVGVNVKVM